jgi:hypothetical protein
MKLSKFSELIHSKFKVPPTWLDLCALTHSSHSTRGYKCAKGGLIRSNLHCFLRDRKLKGRARLLRRWPCIVSRGDYRGDDRHKEPGILGPGRPRSCVRT